MQNSNLTALATLRNLRGKVGNATKQNAETTAGQKKGQLVIPDHFLVIGPDTDRSLAIDNDVNVPATIHR